MMKTAEEFKNMIFSLCSAGGVTGNESAAAQLALDELSKYMTASTDNLGNVVGRRVGSGTRLLLDAHIDRIGLVVTALDGGFVKFAPCGGVDRRVLPSSEVTIFGRQEVYGVVTSTPPHLSKGESDAADCDALSIDTGLDAQTLQELVAQGDRIVLVSRQRELLGGRITSAALDDRAGVAAILRCVEMLDETESDCDLTVVFSVQEESTGGGAKTAAYGSEVDAAIALDVSFARAPDLPEEKTAPLGGGPMIGFAPSLCREMSLALVETARENGIPYNTEVMGGRTGTNSEAICMTKTGIKTALVSIPQRNMHTGVEVCSIDDIENTASLLCKYIQKIAGGTQK